jgi:hypothetical protein
MIRCSVRVNLTNGIGFRHTIGCSVTEFLGIYHFVKIPTSAVICGRHTLCYGNHSANRKLLKLHDLFGLNDCRISGNCRNPYNICWVCEEIEPRLAVSRGVCSFELMLVDL